MNYISKNNPNNEPSGITTYDGVHLNDLGNKLIADEMIKFIVITNHELADSMNDLTQRSSVLQQLYVGSDTIIYIPLMQALYWSMD